MAIIIVACIISILVPEIELYETDMTIINVTVAFG